LQMNGLGGPATQIHRQNLIPFPFRITDNQRQSHVF